MSRGLRARLDRLERAQQAGGDSAAPSAFWDWLAGVAPWEKLDADTQAWIERLAASVPDTSVDPIEAEIQRVLATPDGVAHRRSPGGRVVRRPATYR